MPVRIVNGKVLFAGGYASGTVVIRNDPCCCQDPPTCCDTVVPFSVDVTFGGSTGGSFAACCSEMNGTYVLSADPVEACTWVATLEGPYFGEPTGGVSTGSSQCATTQPDACYTSTFTDFSGTYYTWYFIENVDVFVTLSDTSATGHEVQVVYNFRKVELTPLGCTASIIGPWIWSYSTLTECVEDGVAQATTLSVSDADILIQQCTNGDTVGPTVTVNLV